MTSLFTQNDPKNSREGLFHDLFSEAYRLAGRQELEVEMAGFEAAQRAGETDSIDETEYLAAVNKYNSIRVNIL